MEKFTFTQFLSGWSQPAKDHKVSDNDLKNARTAFKNYVFPTIGICSNDLASKGFGDVCDKLTLQKFMEACVRCYEKETAQNPHLSETLLHPKENLHGFVLFLFDRDFDAKVAADLVSAESKRNYRPPLGRALKWLVKQWWWQEMFPENMPEIAPMRIEQQKRPATRHANTPYALKKEQLPEELVKHLEVYHQFRLNGGAALWKERNRKLRELNKLEEKRRSRRNRKTKPDLSPIKESSYQLEESKFLEFWGWMVEFEGYAIAELNLQRLIDLDLLEEYGEWKTEVQQRTHASLSQLVSGSIGVAKFFNFDKTELKNWSDIEVIRELRDLKTEYDKAYKQEHKDNCEVTWNIQLLTHEELRQLLPYLKQRCAPYSAKVSKHTGEVVRGKKQSDSRLVWYYQAYLLVKYFTYLPNRQEEPRQYAYGITLFRELDDQGEYRYFARNIRHKNDRRKGQRSYPLPKILTKDFDEWVQKYRPKVELAVQSLENWLIFWGHKPDTLEKVKQRLASAYQGKIPSNVKDEQKYIKKLEERYRCIQSRVDAYPHARENFKASNSFFFSPSVSYAENFGKPLSDSCLKSIVQSSVAKASQAVLHKTRWTSPHRFRHIGEKLARKNKKKEVSKMINHDEKMGEEYAQQISQEFEEFEDVVDNWWEED